ncbi:MAG: recombinase family protein, partial [Lachnospiraceae bacterium]|nr:recombinase family protein [Lachnospiraceae bacterium]
PKYYVENHHPAIIDRFTWERVQAAFRGREEVENGAPFKQENARQQHLYRLVCGECGAGFERHGYTGTAAGYRDERGDDLSEEERQFYKETWSYTYRVWRCETKYLGREGKRGSLSKQEREAFERQCPSPIVNETAIEQSFMELLYTLKLDQRLYGEESALARDFRLMCGRMEEEYRKNRPPDRQMELLDQQIAALEAQYREVVFKREGKQDQELACYDQLAEDIQSRIERYAQEKEKRWDIHREAADRKRKFTLFCQCLEKLPDCNRAGQKLNIYGLNADAGPQEGAPPDFLEFDQAMYTAFVRKAIVKGDRIEFMTSFGVRLTCGGIDRNLNSFIGFRRVDENGVIHLLTQSWQVNNARIQYRRKKRVYTGKRKGT